MKPVARGRQAFCREHDVALSTFARWHRILAGQTAPAAAAPRGEPERLFTELPMPLSGRSLGDAPPWEVELALGAGVVLRIHRGEPC